MKKVFSIIAVAVVATFVACGPSAEEKAKMEENAKRIQDSITAAINASMNAATAASDSVAAAAAAAAANAVSTATDAAAKAVEEVKK